MTNNSGISSRLAAYEALRAIWAGEDSSPALSKSCEKYELNRQDIGLAWMITMTVLRTRELIDRAIDDHIRRNKIDPEIRDILRIGAVQIIFLDRVPTFAAVSTSVDLSKKIDMHRASGLVNAVLRKLDGLDEHDIPLPESKLKRIAARFSHPEWLIRRWKEREDYEFATALAAANNLEAPTTCRVNIRKISPRKAMNFLLGQGIEARQIDHFPDYLKIEAPGHPEILPGFQEGYFSPQDPAFSVPVDILDPMPGDRILEIGCAPGGKLTHLAERYGGDIEIHGVDVSQERLEMARDNLLRLGLSEFVQLHSADAREYGAPMSFDAVLIDAPCSSLGVIRRHPEIRYRRTIRDIRSLAKIQAELIAAGLRVIKPEGRLVYCACSTEPEEGENHLNDLPPGIHLDTPEDYQPTTFLQGDVLRTWPHIHNLDSMITFRVRTPR